MLANWGYQDGSGAYFITIDTDKCDGCGKCVEACPQGVFEVGEDPADPLREEPVAFVAEEHRKKLRFSCSPCKKYLTAEGGSAASRTPAEVLMQGNEETCPVWLPVKEGQLLIHGKMKQISLTINEMPVEVEEGLTVLGAAIRAGVYIPTICYHPDLPTFDGLSASSVVYQGSIKIEGDSSQKYQGCQLCLVEIEGEEDLKTSCNTTVKDGMVVHTNTLEIKERRQENLSKILSEHPHTCLVCPQREGCDLRQCTSNVPEKERCCPKFNVCELRKVATHIGIRDDIPRYVPRGLSVVKDEPLFDRDYNLCIGCTRCVRVCNKMRGVEALGFAFAEGKIVVGTVAPTLKDSGCKFCGACVEVCPTGALTDKGISWAERETKLVPCKSTCPAGIDVPRYVKLITQGKFSEAAAVIREKVLFPRVLGYICPRHCEVKCRRGEVNEPIGIRALKRFATEHDDGSWKNALKPGVHSGKKVAIVGSGPAGLSAGFYLTRLGHSVTVFEGASRPGGMMRTGIPRFLLPEEVLDEEIKEILSYGIELKLNSAVEDAGQFLKDGYNAVLIAIGLQEGRKIPIPGSDLEGVLIGLDFLRDISEGKRVRLGQNVLVLGGGGVACDVARTVLRLGVPKVAMACLESRETLPAPSHDIKQVEEEGVKIFPSRSFKQILGEGGAVKGIECLRVKWTKFDEEGKLQLETFPDSEHILEADTVIFAIGQGLNQPFTKKTGFELTPRGMVKSYPETLETTLRGVFISGDAVTGPASVVEAVATGRKVTVSIDKYLGGQGVLEEEIVKENEVLTCLGREEHFAEKERIEPPLLPVEERLRSFEKVELPLSPEQAIAEASRCLKCDLRLQITPPIMPPEKWLEFNAENLEAVPETEGVCQLFDSDRNIVYIKGTMNLRQELEEMLKSYEKAKYFVWEEEPMYTKRESELLQQFMQRYGKMPEGNAGIEEDLF